MGSAQPSANCARVTRCSCPCLFRGGLAVEFGVWMLGVQADGLVKVLNGLGIPAQIDAGRLSLKVGLGVLRINGNGVVEIANRLLVRSWQVRAIPRFR